MVATDHLTVDSYSTVNLTESTGWNNYSNLYANTITVTNGGVLDVNVDQFDTEAFRTDKLELTSGNIADHNGNVVSGVFDINSSDYVLNADLVNDRTWDTSKSNYGYGIVAMNSDGHLTINGNGDVDNGTELDNSSVDNVVAATGNYKVRIDNATGAGAIADYKDKEIIYVNDKNSNATFSAANKADLGAYTYQAEQRGMKWFTEFGHLNRGDMLTSEQHRCHNEKRNFSAEFKRESAQLVVDQNYTVADAASAMDVGLSTMTRWVKQLRDERQGKHQKPPYYPGTN